MLSKLLWAGKTGVYLLITCLGFAAAALSFPPRKLVPHELHVQVYLAWDKKWSEVKSLSHVRLFATPWTVAYQVPPSIGFSRQEYWRGLPFPSPGDLPNPGIEPGSPSSWADALLSEPPTCLLKNKHYEVDSFWWTFLLDSLHGLFVIPYSNT